MAVVLANPSKSATVYRCTVNVKTGEFITGRRWRTLNKKDRCTNTGSNRPRLGAGINNNQPTPVCSEHLQTVRAERAAVYNGNLEASLAAVQDADWMAQTERAAWLRIVAVSQQVDGYSDSLTHEQCVSAAEDAALKTVTTKAMGFYPLESTEAVAAVSDDEVRAVIYRVYGLHVPQRLVIDLTDDIADVTVTHAADGFRRDVLMAMGIAGHAADVAILLRAERGYRMVEPTRSNVTAFNNGMMVAKMVTVEGASQAAQMYLRFRSEIDK